MTLQSDDEQIIDVYRLKFGIRTLSWNSKQFLVNEKPVYFRGFGRHEDSDVSITIDQTFSQYMHKIALISICQIRGKGLDLALLTRDFNLLKWIGANAYRTSHYPYSEESMQFADEHGIMVIDECPSVDTEYDSYLIFLMSFMYYLDVHSAFV